MRTHRINSSTASNASTTSSQRNNVNLRQDRVGENVHNMHINTNRATRPTETIVPIPSFIEIPMPVERLERQISVASQEREKEDKEPATKNPSSHKNTETTQEQNTASEQDAKKRWDIIDPILRADTASSQEQNTASEQDAKKRWDIVDPILRADTASSQEQNTASEQDAKKRWDIVDPILRADTASQETREISLRSQNLSPNDTPIKQEEEKRDIDEEVALSMPELNRQDNRMLRRPRAEYIRGPNYNSDNSIHSCNSTHLDNNSLVSNNMPNEAFNSNLVNSNDTHVSHLRLQDPLTITSDNIKIMNDSSLSSNGVSHDSSHHIIENIQSASVSDNAVVSEPVALPVDNRQRPIPRAEPLNSSSHNNTPEEEMPMDRCLPGNRRCVIQ